MPLPFPHTQPEAPWDPGDVRWLLAHHGHGDNVEYTHNPVVLNMIVLVTGQHCCFHDENGSSLTTQEHGCA